MTTPTPPPWDSPKVEMRKSWPSWLDMRGTLAADLNRARVGRVSIPQGFAQNSSSFGTSFQGRIVNAENEDNFEEAFFQALLH